MIKPHKVLLAALALTPALLSAQTILIDFGATDAQTLDQPETWNNAHLGIVDGGETGTLFADMVDTTNTGTGITLNITNAFDGRNTAGFGSSGFNPSGTAPYPATATEDSFYTSTSSATTTPGDGMATLEFSGLDTSKTYTFTIYASREADNNRDTDYIFNGSNSETVTLNAASNISETVTASGIAPDESGVITLTVQAGANNTSGYSYLGSLEITAASIPEPSQMAFLFGGLVAGFILWRRRR